LALDAIWLISMMFAEAWFPTVKVVPEFTAVPVKTPAAELDPSSIKKLSIIISKSP